VKVPVLAVEVVVKVRVLPKGGVPDDRLKLVLIPVGADPTHPPLSETVGAAPERRLALIVEAVEMLRAIDMLSGDAVIEKSSVTCVQA
jgi:hypothetical protein